jgi:hypothetical protein
MMFMFKACIYIVKQATLCLEIFYLLHTTRIEKDLHCRVLFRHYNSAMLPPETIVMCNSFSYKHALISTLAVEPLQAVWEA